MNENKINSLFVIFKITIKEKREPGEVLYKQVIS